MVISWEDDFRLRTSTSTSFCCALTKMNRGLYSVSCRSLKDALDSVCASTKETSSPAKTSSTTSWTALKTSKKFLMVFSEHFAKSQWCQFELDLCPGARSRSWRCTDCDVSRWRCITWPDEHHDSGAEHHDIHPVGRESIRQSLFLEQAWTLSERRSSRSSLRIIKIGLTAFLPAECLPTSFACSRRKKDSVGEQYCLKRSKEAKWTNKGVN